MVRNNKQGSALLLITMVISVLSLCIITFWSSGALFQDMSIVRLAYEQKYRVAQGGLTYAIDLCKKNFDALIAEKKRASTPGEPQVFTIETGPWELSEHKSYTCNIQIIPCDNLLQLQSMVYDMNGKQVFVLSCLLCEYKKSNKQQRQYCIKNWKIGED